LTDLLVRGGRVIDGFGGPARKADVAISSGQIEAVGDLPAMSAPHEIDATGLVVTPGLIDIHSHSDFTLLVDGRAHSQLYQGVTTEVVGNCGHGCAPLAGDDVGRFIPNIYGWRARPELEWRSLDQYLCALQDARPAVNVAALVPHGNLRIACVDDTSRPATDDETGQMVRLLAESLEAGAFGYSTGLEYPAERASASGELVRLCREVAAAGGLYAAHTRNRERSAVEAVDEAVEVARQSGVRLQVSHILPRRGGPSDNSRRCIGAVDRAVSSGIDAALDIHTRLHGITNLINVLPPSIVEGGPRAVREALSDPRERERIKSHDSMIASFGLGGWDRVYVFSAPAQPDLNGRSVASLCSTGVDPFDAIFDVLHREAQTGDPSRVLCICHAYEESDLLDAVRHRSCMVGSDATALCTDGPLAGESFLGAYSWAGWFFGRAVTETRTLPLEEAVRRLTTLPAERLSLRDRGAITKGMAADVAVFDPERFRAVATLESPNEPAVGMRHVIVNGTVAFRDGRPTGARTGRVLRRR
jgi:N-acyl-D-aspartate/D-glutamate deacylase